MAKLKIAWLWLIPILLWILESIFALGNISIPIFSAITVLATLLIFVYSFYSLSQFKLGWEAIAGIGILGIFLLLALTYSSLIAGPLGTFSGAFLWTGSTNVVGGIVAGIFIVLIIAILRKLAIRKK